MRARSFAAATVLVGGAGLAACTEERLNNTSPIALTVSPPSVKIAVGDSAVFEFQDLIRKETRLATCAASEPLVADVEMRGTACVARGRRAGTTFIRGTVAAGAYVSGALFVGAAQ